MTKKKCCVYTMLIGVLFISLFAFPCQVNAKSSKKISLNKNKVSVEVGKTYTLKVKGTKKTVKWSTSNKKIAKVTKKGKVTGVKKGSCKVYAKVSGKKLTCKVSVKAASTTEGTKTSSNSVKATTEAKTTQAKTTEKKTTEKVTTEKKTTEKTTEAVKTTEEEAVVVSCATVGHSWVETTPWRPETNACIVKGKKSYICSRCSASYVSSTEYVEALGHDYQLVKTVEPTCTAAGYKEYSCKYCNRSTYEDYGEAKGHSYGESTETYTEGCTVLTVTKKCTTCGYVNTTTSKGIANHDWKEDYRNEPVCDVDGAIFYVCTRKDCGASKTVAISTDVSKHTDPVIFVYEEKIGSVTKNTLVNLYGSNAFENRIQLPITNDWEYKYHACYSYYIYCRGCDGYVSRGTMYSLKADNSSILDFSTNKQLFLGLMN